MPDQDSIFPRAFMGLIAGGIALFITHLVMAPVPISAGPAFAAGALGFFLMRTDTTAMVVMFASLGAGFGVVLHRNTHLAGDTPMPGVSMLEHLAVEGLIGWGAALGCLLLMGAVMRLMERR